jgi:hypothetical protein
VEDPVSGRNQQEREETDNKRHVEEEEAKLVNHFTR